MIRKDPLKAIFESAGGHYAGMRTFRHQLGLEDEHGNRYRNSNGDLVLGKQHIKPNEVSLKCLAEAIGSVGNGNPDDLFDPRLRAGGHQTFEAGSAAVQPSAFANINAYQDATGGLLEVRVLEAFHAPKFIGDQLMPTVQSSQRSELMPGVANIGDKAEVMTPGERHPRIQLSERYVETPKTIKFGLGIDVTREAVFYDLTSQVLKQAESLGDTLRLKKEKRQLQCFLGLTNTYKYSGTSYNTYLTSGNWINKQQNNLVDWTDVDNCLTLFSNMTDQETGERIDVTGPYKILVMPSKLLAAKKMLTDTTIEARTNSAAVVAAGANPLNGLFEGDVITSPIAYQLLTESGISAADAKQYWYMGQFSKSFEYKQNFPLRVQRVDANSYTMADQDLVLSVFADEMGVPAIIEPRYTIQNIAE